MNGQRALEEEVLRLAEAVFESRGVALRWMTSPNETLGDIAPAMLCRTAVGARQVRRVLNSLEWGGVV
ncbi:MAG: DUF2384 domain-containing protein [Candidimonas sp.]|nr:MAG: DUF2384 domain-containing protein [Candidimonas sp.]TAM23187.1 MAG: DUF2384 domain-containing protein [Candidimonas sp.]